MSRRAFWREPRGLLASAAGPFGVSRGAFGSGVEPQGLSRQTFVPDGNRFSLKRPAGGAGGGLGPRLIGEGRRHRRSTNAYGSAAGLPIFALRGVDPPVARVAGVARGYRVRSLGTESRPLGAIPRSRRVFRPDPAFFTPRDRNRAERRGCGRYRSSTGTAAFSARSRALGVFSARIRHFLRRETETAPRGPRLAAEKPWSSRRETGDRRPMAVRDAGDLSPGAV